MKKIKLMALLLVSMLSINLLGADNTQTTTFTTNSFSKDGWSKTSQTSIQQYASPNIQVTWSNIKSKPLILENSNDFEGKVIKKVSINCRTNGGSGTYAVTVGGTSLGSSKTINSSTQSDIAITHTTGLEGKIVITVSSSSTSNSFYIKSITVTYAEPAPKVETTITLSEAGNESQVSGTHYVGDKYPLPTTCSQTCGTKTFVGWSTETVDSKTKPTSKFYEPGAQVTLEANNKFYAVFADAGASVETSSSWTISSDNIAMTDESQSSGYNKYAGDQTIDGFEIHLTDVMILDGNIQFKKSTGVIYNKTSFGKITKIEITGSSLGVYESSSIITTKPSSGAKSASGSSPYTYTLSGNNGFFYLTNTSSSAVTPSQIKVTYKKNTTSYSNYTTTCCTPWMAPTLTYTASASIGAQLNPSWGAGTTHGTLTYSSSDEDVLEVDENGVVTTNAAGTAHVIASWSSTDGYCDNSTTSNEITVTAAYNITYKDKGGVDFSGTHEDGYPQTHTYGTATTLKSASKDYYTFNGWFANESCTGSAIQTVAADAYTADFTLYAKWTPIVYDIKYTLNGGTNAFSNPATYTYETETITLQAPSKTGHDFQGWFKESTFENEVKTIANRSHGDIDLFAKWSVKNYTLTWDLNGGSVKTAGTTAGSVAFGTALTAPIVERTGYKFTGWKKGGVSVDFTQTVTMPAENATYVAQWTPNKYDIIYKDENNADFTGSKNGLPEQHTYDTPTPLVNSSKTGYNFIGWFTDPACTSSISTLGATDYLDAITIYAKWSEIMPTGITLSPDVTEITDLIYNGSSSEQKTTITAMVNPSTAFNTAFEWSVVEGSDVVEVNENGLITAHKAGTAKVRVTSTRDANIYKEISVTVHALPQITWKNMDGSTFTTSNGTSAGKVGSLPVNKPTSCDTEKYPYFRGWSATNFGKTTTNPESGFVTKDTEVALDGVYTYYAVFSSKVASLNFGTPAVSDDFESCTEQTSNTQVKPGTISNCGIFTSCYNGNTSNYYGVQSDSYGKYLHVKGSSSPLSLSYDNSSTFSTTGAWSVKINKSANCHFGFYSTGASSNIWTKANARVYMQYNDGVIQVADGTSTGGWVPTGYTYSGDETEVVEITMIYNATSNATTYGDNISLGSGKAHVYVNGDPIMNGDTPKEMTISTTATQYFRIASQNTTVAKFYDVNIYNALPTTTSIEGCEWATQCCTPWTPTLSYANTTMQVGEEQDAVVGTTHGTATYTSSNPSSVEVNESTGHIKAVGGGTATISVTWTGDDTYCEQSTSSQEITVNGSLQVSFNGNGADGGTAMEPQSVEYGVETKINKNTYTKIGYTFLGWNTDKDATSILYTDEQSVAFTAGVELFAIWRINAHNVIVQNATGGTIAISPTTTTIDYGTTVTATATLATGYNFVTWSATPSVVTFAEATNKSTTFSMPDADITLTASYTPILVTKIDLKKGSEVVTALEFEKGVTDPVTLTTAFTPADALDKTVEWQSGNTEVVTVNNGVLTAQGLGTAVVTATSTVVPIVAGSVSVTVYEWQDADPKYTLTNQPASTVYYETNKIDFANWTIKHNFKRSDDAIKTKQETVAVSDWTVTLGGVVIENKYTLTTADNGKALVIKVGETTLYNETLTVNEKAKHTYIDRVHGNEDKVMIDDYTIPSLDDKTAATEGDCATTHYVFKGWVAEANADVPTDANLIAAGGHATAEADATFYAVWAEHRMVKKEFTMFYGWEATGSTSGWKSAASSTTSAYYNGSRSGSLGSACTAIETTNKIAKPISLTYYARKGSGNDEAKQYIILQYSSTGSNFNDINEGKITNETLVNGNAKTDWKKVTVDLTPDTYKDKYFRIHKDANATQYIDDVTLIYEGEAEADIDYITECVTRYELTFDANGGTGTAPATILLKEGGKVALPNATLTKAYNYFNGWNTQADGQGTHYAVGDEYTMGATATTLYADWAPRAVESLVITTEATTKEFGIGQTFSSEGLKVKANYIGGETETNVDFTTNFDGHAFTESETGTPEVIVSYKGATTTYNILVAPALIVRFFVNGTQIQEKAVFDKKIGAMPNAMTSDAWTNPENEFIASHYPVFAGWTLATSDDNIEFINEGTDITTDVNVNAVFAQDYTINSIGSTAIGESDLTPNGRYVIGVTVNEITTYYQGTKDNSDWAEMGDLASAELVSIIGKQAPYAMQQTNEKYIDKKLNARPFLFVDDAVYAMSITSDKYIQYGEGDYYLSRNLNSGITNTGLRWYGTGDNYPKAFLYEADVTYDHLTIAPKGDHVRTGLTYDNAGTICLPYAVKADDYKGASVWSIESRVGSGDMIYAITLVQEVDEGGNKNDLEAGKPYIFFAEESEFQLFYSGDEYTGSTSVWANGLIGNLNIDNIVINEGGYAPGSYLINQNKLMECGKNCQVPQYRAYVQANLIGAGEPVQAPMMAPRRVIGDPNVAPTNLNGLNGSDKAVKFLKNSDIYILRNAKLYNAQGQLVK